MKLLFVAIFASGTMACGHAGPTERAIVAAMKLSEQPNYRWITTVADDARTYDIEGKTGHSGYTWMRLPMVRSIAQRLGRDAESTLEAVFHGDAAVIRVDRGWKTLKELPKRKSDWGEDIDLWPASATSRANMAAAALAGLDPLDPPPFVVIVPPPQEDEDRRPYCNAQFAVSRPHEDLAVIVSSYVDLNVNGDVVSGTLSDLGAQLLLVHDGQDQIQTVCAGGAFKLQITHGIVTRYCVRLEGILVINRKKVLVHQESSTVVSGIGTTAFEIADEARRKLGP